MARAVLLTGGNLGDVAATLAVARRKLAERAGEEVTASSLYESESWGFDAPEHFLNQVLVCETPLSPEQLLDCCQQIEREAGRVRPLQVEKEKDCASIGMAVDGEAVAGGGGSENRSYASRTLDIDLLFYGDEVIDTPRLQVPHPLISARGFVLAPLAEVLPDLQHPLLHRSVRQLLADFVSREGDGGLPFRR